MAGRLLRFPMRPITTEEGMSAARQALATAIEMRASRSAELRLEEPETLLGACGLLQNQLESSPGQVVRNAEVFYHFRQQPRLSVGILHAREIDLREMALIVGTPR